MRNEDYFEDEEDYFKEQAYLEAQNEWEYKSYMEEQSLLRREAKISVMMHDKLIIENDRIEAES